ncbi:MAG: sulfatase [Chloroflexi bacterium]|nr:sulfatase [Chloroflexota bacterium]
MKAIMVMFDSLNRHYLPPYGCDWVHAPNFARLAQRTVTFDNSYIASMPCMPARRDLMTGRCNFLHRSWGPLEPFDDALPELLSAQGVYTHLVTDHQHYWEDGGATYHYRYQSFEFVRGQEGDPYKGQVRDPEAPPMVGRTLQTPLVRQDWINRSHLRDEADFPQIQTFTKGLEFIRTNASADRWFLQLETFDPHEPFFAPQRFRDLYPHHYTGPHFDWPPYAPVRETPDQVQHARYQYAALLSMCDEQLGKVLDLMDELNLWDDTLLIVNTDHGFLLGEHEEWAKIVQPFYNEVAHTPLFIWDPRCRQAGERRQSLVQIIDLTPTLLDYFGIPIPPDVVGHALRDTIANDTPVREFAFFGVHGGHVNLTDGRYVYMRGPAVAGNGPLFNYTLMPTHMRSRFSVAELRDLELAGPFHFTKGVRTLKVPVRGCSYDRNLDTMLFDLAVDWQQLRPYRDSALEAYLCVPLIDLMRQHHAPPEQFERLGLTAMAVPAH